MRENSHISKLQTVLGCHIERKQAFVLKEEVVIGLGYIFRISRGGSSHSKCTQTFLPCAKIRRFQPSLATTSGINRAVEMHKVCKIATAVHREALTVSLSVKTTINRASIAQLHSYTRVSESTTRGEWYVQT